MNRDNTRWYDFLKPKVIVNNYFWLITITAILNVVIGVGWLSTLVLPIVIYILLYQFRKEIQYNFLDLLWFVMFFWMISTWLYNDYPHKDVLIARYLIGQMAYMLTYWLSRRTKRNIVSTIIGKSYIPLLLTALVGIYCFFLKPGWYMHLIQMQIASKDHVVSEAEVLELSRLRSIFDSPYTLSYFIAIVLIFYLFQIVRKEVKKKAQYIVIIPLVVALLLTMQRGPILSVVMGFVIAIVYDVMYMKLSRSFYILAVAFMLGVVGTSVLMSSMNKNSAKFFTNKVLSVTNNSNNYAKERFFLEMNDLNLKFDYIGDGVGRHNMYADRYNPGTSIRDGEYMKILKEQGYIGMSIFVLFAIAALSKCIINFKYLYFEFSVIVMLLFCMIGANPLSTGDKHPIVFWLILGQISRFRNGYKNINNYCNL